MYTTGKRIITKILAIAIILTMTMADICLVGERAISYAIDQTQVNNSNVGYNVYFVGESKAQEATATVDQKDLKLGIEVSVKKDGYLENGKIELEDNANFKFNKTVNNDYIKSIEDKAIYLKQINEGENVIIEVGIEFADAEEMSADYLSKNSTVKLTGSYTNSKNVDKDKVAIEGNAYVRANWKSPSKIESEQNAKLLSNSVYTVDGVEKRIVQILVSSNIKNNSYPVKSTNIQVSIPNSPETVTVNKRTTSATNGDREFNNDNYKYQDGILTITVENGGDNKMSWVKNSKDIFVVTAEYAKETEVTNSVFTTNAKITTYDERELNTNTELTIPGEKDEIASIAEVENETSIGKGKLYAGENRNYSVTSNVYIDYAKAIDSLTIEENIPLYVTKDEEKEANVEYIQTSIDKAEFAKLFGEDGTIDIYDQSNNLATTINGTTNADENGKIIIKYNNGVKKLRIETSKPIVEGTLKIENEKRLLKTNYTREEVQELTQIKDRSKVTYTRTDTNKVPKEATATIDLKETESKASLEVEPTVLTTSQDAHKLTMRVILEANNEYRDLYKNPVIKVALPSQVTSISANYSLINAKDFSIDENRKEIKNENGKPVMIIPLKGEQTTYSGEAIKGIELLIEATVKLNKLATNSNEEIVLNYTNENATKYADNGVEKVNIKIQSPDSMILTNDISKYNVSTLGDEGKKEIVLEANAEANTATVKTKIINNEQAEIKNVKVTGTIANIDGRVQRTSDIKTNKENAKISINGENYTVTVDSLKVGEELDLSYDLSIAKNLPYNLSTETGYTVSYTDSLTGKEKQAKATTLALTTGKVAELKTLLTAQVGGETLKEGDVVKAGEIITYTATISNAGREKAENVIVGITVPENTTLVELNPKYLTVREDGKIEGEYFTKSSNNKLQGTIEAGKTVNCNFLVRVNEDLTQDKDVQTKITITQNEKQVEEKIINNKIASANLIATLAPSKRAKNEQLLADVTYTSRLTIKNNTSSEQKNVKVSLNVNEPVKVTRISYQYGEEFKEVEEGTLTFTIDSIAAGQEMDIGIITENKLNANKMNNAEMSAIVIDSSNNKYRSNQLSETIKSPKVEVSLTAQSSSKNDYLIAGDEIKYTITVKNTGNADAEELVIKDMFSDYLTLQSIKLNGKDCEYEEQPEFGEEMNYNILAINSPLKVGETAILEISAKVNEEISTQETLKVVNKAIVSNIIDLAESDQKVYYIRTIRPDDGENSENSKNSENSENQEYSEIDEDAGKHVISGTVWLDKDQSGSRDSEEQLLSGIKVYVINVLDNRIVADTTTNAEGFYTLSLVEGEYVVAFEYDTEKYIPTVYQAEDISEDINSDAVKATRTVDGEEKILAYTDSIYLTDSRANIDLGLAEAQIFSLEIEKVVSKMIVTSSSGTETYNFDDTNLAKVEIAGKNLNNSNVLIEYKIKVTNTGEIAGYAKSIVDYIPSSLTFNSSLNNDWYKKGKNIYTSALADTIIEPGETKEVTLTLTKKMTESNTGLTNNKVAIESSYNSLGIANTAGTSIENAGTSNDSKNSADIIVGVKTGAVVSYVSLTLTIIIAICGVAYLVYKKILLKEIRI